MWKLSNVFDHSLPLSHSSPILKHTFPQISSWLPKNWKNKTQQKNSTNSNKWYIGIFPSYMSYLALLMSMMSVKRKICLSWVCRPVFSWTYAWLINILEGLRYDCTSRHVSGLTGERLLSLKNKESNKNIILPKYINCAFQLSKDMEEGYSIKRDKMVTQSHLVEDTLGTSFIYLFVCLL